MEHEAAEKGESDRVLLDEEASPTAGRRFTGPRRAWPRTERIGFPP